MLVFLEVLLLLLVASLKDSVTGQDTFAHFNDGSELEQFHKKFFLPFIMADAKNCTLSACEALKIVSQLIFVLKTTGIGPQYDRLAYERQTTTTTSNSISPNSLHPIDFDLVKRVRQIESRLRSVEQPVWVLAPGSQLEWNHCTSGICRCNPHTKSFTCWNTNLKSVPVTQVIPMNMVTIDLSRNSLSTLHKDTFRGLTLLLELDLSNNVLDFLPFDIFKDLDSLIQLRLQHNQLEDLDPRTFWKLRNLNLLDLSKNSLMDIPETIFNHAQRLTVINLSDNKIKNFPPQLLHDQMILEELDMSRNKITYLMSGSMRYLSHLKVLDFSWNSISAISDDFFSGLKSLRALILHNNRITSISRVIFGKLSRLVTLDLTMNRISKIDGRAFSELTNLRELFLGQNALSHIPDGLFLNTISLTRLTFFSNNLTILEASDFEGLQNLKHLMLNNNILKYFDSKAFSPLKSLEKLRIDSNKLQYLPHGALNGLDKLVAVKLDKNPWHCDCRALYLARWIREYVAKLWDGKPMCRGPGDLGGHEVGLLRYDDLCDGQWASMLSLSPRLPVRKHRISTPMNYTDYFNLYLRHIYTSSTSSYDADADGMVLGDEEIFLSADDIRNMKRLVEEQIMEEEKRMQLEQDEEIKWQKQETTEVTTTLTNEESTLVF